MPNEPRHVWSAKRTVGGSLLPKRPSEAYWRGRSSTSKPGECSEALVENRRMAAAVSEALG